MIHTGPNSMAQLSRNIHRLGLQLRNTRHGWMICRPYFWGLRVVIKEFATLLEAAHWVKDETNATG